MASNGKKVFKPLTYVEALALIERINPALEIDEMNLGSIMTLAELYKVNLRLDDIENQATEMMSPDNMMEMAQKFLGTGF